MTFVDVWVGYAIFGVTAFSVVFAWAVRARQFSNLDRGRYIPLDAGEPVTTDDVQCRGSRVDRWGLAVVVAIAAGLLATALVLGIWSAGHGTHH
jgi:hypothetical protein